MGTGRKELFERFEHLAGWICALYKYPILLLLLKIKRLVNDALLEKQPRSFKRWSHILLIPFVNFFDAARIKYVKIVLNWIFLADT